MRFLPTSHSRLLMGLLIALLLILGVLMRARLLLWEGFDDSPQRDQPSKRLPEPPILPGIRAPSSSEKGPSKPLVSGNPPETLDAAPAVMAPQQNALLKSPPLPGNPRILPPIMAEPDEEEGLDFTFEITGEPVEEDAPETEPAPAMAPEQSPDFALEP